MDLSFVLFSEHSDSEKREIDLGMAEDADHRPTIDEAPKKSTTGPKKESGTVSKQNRGILSCSWNLIFGTRNEDFEKRLQQLSKEEASGHARMKRRAEMWQRTSRNLIIFYVILEKYDTDPAAKAAAASVQASKLGADSGLKVYVGDEPKLNVSLGKSNDVETVVVQSTGSGVMQQFVEETPQDYSLNNPEVSAQDQQVL
ncbi:uncharacterized protein At2g24330-like [Tasmannia lanceolata]|uniref:uncharacterized protein At2g24330-like n=1 Tax=Tasmannia lanceolata TaxID=3420 RepID=UPI00406419FE